MFFCGYAKKGTFPVDGTVYRKYVPYCKKCNKKDSRTVIQNDKLEIVVSFENLVLSLQRMDFVFFGRIWLICTFLKFRYSEKATKI